MRRARSTSRMSARMPPREAASMQMESTGWLQADTYPGVKAMSENATQRTRPDNCIIFLDNSDGSVYWHGREVVCDDELKGMLKEWMQWSMDATLSSKLTAANARIAELEKDAARYRWLRVNGDHASVFGPPKYPCPDDLLQSLDLDAAIDAAMSAKEKP